MAGTREKKVCLESCTDAVKGGSRKSLTADFRAWRQLMAETSPELGADVCVVDTCIWAQNTDN
jgi:hypothetical protein